MGSSNNRICVFSSMDVLDYTRTGRRPNCQTHEHLSRHDANDLTATVLYSKVMFDGTIKTFFEYDWVRQISGDPVLRTLKAIVPMDAREWVIRRSGGRFGVEVHQLAHSGGRL